MKVSKFYGIETIDYIYFNNVADPLVEYKGFRWSVYDLIDSLYEYWKDVNEQGGTFADFDDFVKAHAESELDDFLFGLGYMDIGYIKKWAPEHFEALRDALWDSHVEQSDACVSDLFAEWDAVRSDKNVLEHYAGVGFVVEDFVSAA